MKANELRIGNSVEFKGDIISVTYHHIRIQSFADAGHISSITNEKFIGYNPIELTEEWLVKFGFEKSNRDIQGFEKNKLIVEWLFERWTGRLYYDCNTSIQIIELKYVHQLQNLYFALTGEELNG